MYEHLIKLNKKFKARLEFVFIFNKILEVQDLTKSVLNAAKNATEEFKSCYRTTQGSPSSIPGGSQEHLGVPKNIYLHPVVLWKLPEP